MKTGIIKFFNKQKGYGFITVPNFQDYYFPSHEIVGITIPCQGDSVRFIPNIEPNGKNYASKVTVTTRLSQEERRIQKIPYRGKATYTTITEGSDREQGLGSFVGGAFGDFVGGTAGGIISSLFGGGGEGRTTRSVEITSPCLKCGGTGQVTARADGFIGFQCKTCRSFWKKRDVY